jgi:conjugative relaxase-like TrwC/TraI family protein
MAEYLQGSRDVPEMAAKMASYLGESYAMNVTAGTAALPMLDMHPLIADLLGIDTTRSLRKEEMTHLLAGGRADGQAVPGRDVQPSTKDNVRLGFCDFTFSAPKSLSIAISLAETEEERITLEACFMRANNRLMGVVAEEIGGARQGHAGRDGVVPGHVAVIQYHHHTARPVEMAPDVLRAGDMQRHIHNIIPHVTITDDGQVKAPNLGASKGRIHEWGAIGHAFLATELRAKGVRVEIDPKTGLSHLPDVPEMAVDLFSTRTRTAEAAARAVGEFDTLDKRDRARAVKGQVKAGRKDKEDLSEAAFWKRTADDAGYQHKSVIDPANRRELPGEAERGQIAYEAALPLLEPEWERRAKLDGPTIRTMAARGMIASGIERADEINAVIEAFETRGVRQGGQMVTMIPGRERGERFASATTQLHVDREREAIRLLKSAAADRSGDLTHAQIDAAAGRVAGRLGLDFASTKSGQDQLAMAHVFGTSGKAVVGVGGAGAGKTGPIAVVVDAHHAAGFDSYGVTLAWRQTHGLKRAGVGKPSSFKYEPDTGVLVEAGIGKDRAFAMAPFLKALEMGRIKPGAKTIVVIDEIATIDTQQILELARARAKYGFKVVGVGDPAQCGAINAGNTVALFRHALGTDQVPELLESVRQRRVEGRETAKLIRDGKAGEALPRKEARGLLALAPGEYEDAIKAGVIWLEKRQADTAGREHYTVGVSLPTNADVYAFGLEYRARQRAGGALQGRDWKLGAVDPRGVQYDLPLAIGDKVRLFNRVNASYGKASKGYFGDNGTVADVVAIGANNISLRRADGKVGTIGWATLQDKDTGRVRLAYGSALTIDARQSETLTDHLTLLPDGSQAIDGRKFYSASTRAREDDMMIVSLGAEKTEIRNRRPLGDPWLAEATPGEMRQAVIDNMARNLSRQPEKQLGVDFLAKSAGARGGGMDAQQASWTKPAARWRGHKQHAHQAVADLKNAIAHSPIKLLPGPEQVRREKRSMRPAAERPKPPRTTHLREHADVVAEFADALRREGFQLRGAPVMDGKWQREKVEGDRGHTKSGRYRAFTDGLPAGFIQNFKRGDGVTWHVDRPTTSAMTDAERQQLAASRAKRAQEQAEMLSIATTKAQDRWAAGTRVTQHPYLKAKGITTDAEAFRRDQHSNLMTAMVDGTGLVRNVQMITPDGQKRFMPGAQVSGLFSLVGRIQHDQPVMIAEGVATAKTMHDATGLPVVVAYNAGNLGHVSKIIAEIAPHSRQIFAADNDWHLPLKDVPQPNVGKEKAEAAAKGVGGVVLLPSFDDTTLKGTPTDWNDFAAVYGKARLTTMVNQALVEQGIDMEETKKRKVVTQEMRDLARQTTAVQQNDAQVNQSREAHRQAEEHHQSRGIER